MADDFHNTRGIGDNKPPPLTPEEMDPYKLIDPKIVVPVLAHHITELPDRREELIAGIGRWIDSHTPNYTPDTAQVRPLPRIENDQDCADAQDYLKQLREYATKEVEPIRKKVKDSIDKAAAAVQGWFLDGMARPVNLAKQPIEDAYTRYLLDKDARIRRERAAAAAAQQAEARRLADQATRARSAPQRQKLIEEATAAEDFSSQLFADAEADTRELTRMRGDEGSVGGLVARWQWERENLIELVQAVAQGREPIDMLTTNDPYINGLVRPKEGRRKIPGLRIFETKVGR